MECTEPTAGRRERRPLRRLSNRRHLIRHSVDRDTPNDTFSSRRRLWANEIRRHDEEGSAARGPHPALRATCPPCGARKTVRAYAIPPVFRPLRKLRPCFFCHLQRKAAIPRAREGFGWAGDDVGPYVSTAKRAEATTTPTSDGLLHAGCHLPLCRGGLGGWVIVSSPTTAFEQTTPHPSFGGP